MAEHFRAKQHTVHSSQWFLRALHTFATNRPVHAEQGTVEISAPSASSSARARSDTTSQRPALAHRKQCVHLPQRHRSGFGNCAILLSVGAAALHLQETWHRKCIRFFHPMWYSPGRASSGPFV